MLEDRTVKAHEFCTRHDVPPSEFSKSASGMDLSEVLNKPLPRVPKHQSLDAVPGGPQALYDDAIKALELNATNQTTVHDTENDAEAEFFHRVSHSVCTSSGHTDTQSSRGTGEGECLSHEEIAPHAVPVTAKAVHFGDKVSSLMQPADVEEPNPRTVQPLVKHREAKHLFKVPRLQKGREVFTRAKKAISERLSSSASSKEELKWDKAKHDRYAPQSPGTAGIVDEKYRFNDNDTNLQRLNRRLAEGANLSNRKVKALTTGGSVFRKPTPIHNSMKSPMHWSDTLQDPFSDEQLSTHGMPSSDLFDPNLDDSRRKTKSARRIGTYGPLPSSSQLILPIEELSLYNTPEDRPFSDQFSGLRQHPGVGFFSSSPIGFSTPRFRLEPEVHVSGKKRLSVVPAYEPSLLDFNCDGLSEDEISKLPTLPTLKFDKTDLTRKRKNAAVDQGLEPTPVTKKAKTDEMQRALNLATLNRTPGGPLSVDYGNRRCGRIPISRDTDQGMTVFDAPEGGESTTSLGSPQFVKAAPNAKRSSMPVSFKSAKSSQSQSNTPDLVGPTADDLSSADELQMH